MKINKHNIFFAIIILLLILFVFIKCSENKIKTNEQKKVIATFYPVYLGTLNIATGIEDIEISNLTSDVKACIHDYTLSTVQMIEVTEALLLITNGAGMEPFITNIIKNNKDVNIIDTSINTNIIKKTYKSESITNSHIYLSINNYIIQIENICEALKSVDKDNAKKYEQNKNKYIKELELLNDRLKKVKDKINGTKIIIYNEAIQYIASDLDLQVVENLEIDHESGISPSGVAHAIDTIKKENIKYIFVPKDYDKKIINNIIKGLGITIIELDLLTHGEDNKNVYINVFKENLNNIEKAMLK